MPHLEVDGKTVEVEVISRASHHGQYVQVDAVDDETNLTDKAGEPPWVSEKELE